MLNQWNGRYGAQEYAYGTEPNLFFRSVISGMNPGEILLPAEGEGRNAVYAAKLGWSTCAFDQSEQGRIKALQLAKNSGVTIDYLVNDFNDLPYRREQFDLIALIFAHFPASLKSAYHQQLIQFLKPGGTVVFEAFAKKHLNYNSENPTAGGPKDSAMLFSVEELQSDFKGFEFLQLEEVEPMLDEGKFHQGKSATIRMIARKIVVTGHPTPAGHT